MTYEEKKKLIEAAKVLEKNCTEIIGPCKKKECLFHTCKNPMNCSLYSMPAYYTIPTLTRWTPEDVALAKALKACGIDRILKDSDCSILLYDGGHKYVGTIETDVFLGLVYEAGISIDTIIKEAEEG